MKKALVLFLSVLMATLCVMPGVASHTPAQAYAPYDAAKVGGNDAAYIDGLSYDQLAGIVLDYLDLQLGKIDEAVEIAQGVTVELTDLLDVSTLMQWAYEAIDGDMLGGDFDALDATALNGLTRAGGDLNFIYGIIAFMGDNADLFGKVFCWEEGQTFDCGKLGEYFMGLPADDSARLFYEDYILGNDIQEAFTAEVAGEMAYAIGEGETLDDIINNGILDWVTGLFTENELLSADAAADVKASFNLRTTDVYTLLKNFVGVLMEDNRDKLDLYLNLYLDNYLRLVLNATFGYTPVVGTDVPANAAAVAAAFKAVYADIPALYALAGDKVYFQYSDLTYYEVTIDEADVVAVHGMEFVNASGIEIAIPTINIKTKGADGDALIREYAPTTTNPDDYQPSVYSSYGAAAGVPVAGASLPAAYAAVLTEGDTYAMDEYIKVEVVQNDEITMSTSVEFSQLKAAAEAAALQLGQQMAASMGATVNDVSIDFGYTGYATDNTFIMQVDCTAADANATAFGFTTTLDVSGAINNPVATVVIDGMTAPGSADDASGLFNFINRDFVVDYSEFLDLAGNYDEFNGVIGQANHILYGVLEMLLSEEGFASLALVDGNNTNLTDNLQKLASKADALLATAKSYMDEEGLDAYLEGAGIDDLFASSHGFNTSMLYELDFSSVETLYVCVIELALDLLDDFDTDGVVDLIHELHEVVEGLETLDQIAVAASDVAMDKLIAKIGEVVGEYNTVNETAHVFDYVNTPSVVTAATQVDAKDEIMTKLVSLGVYAANFAADTVLKDLLDKVVDEVNLNFELSLGDTDFNLGIVPTGEWETDLTALVDRFIELTDGILLASGTIAPDAPVFDKISTLANAVLPLSTFFSNCATANFACDLGYILDTYLFTDALNGDFEGFLRLFEAYNAAENNKPGDLAAGEPVTYAIIKASDYIVDAFFPGTVNVEDFADLADYTGVQDSFTSSANDRIIAANNMRSINGVKADLIPAALKLIRETGILPSLVAGECEHSNTAAVEAIPVTCVTTGYSAGVRCRDCGIWVSGHEATAPLGHAYGEAVVTPATCTADGVSVKTCGNCFDVLTEVLPATGHAWSWVVDTPATCGTDGVKHEACANCTEIRNAGTVIPATGAHTYGAAVVTPATCTANGSSVKTCTGCGKVVSETIPALGHNWTWITDRNPTCGVNGSKHQKCTRCTATQANGTVIPATGNHTDADGNYSCDVCGAALEQPPTPEPSFFEKIKQFFQRILDWFRNLFS